MNGGMGWTCPKCSRVYAPSVQSCTSCPPTSVWSYVVSTGSDSKATASLDLLKSLAEDKNETLPKSTFVSGSEKLVAFFSFGSTAPEAIRSMADGLEEAGIEFVDGLSISYEYDISEEHEYVVTAYVYPYRASKETL